MEGNQSLALEVQEIKRKSKPSLIRLINGKSLSARAIRDILKSIGVDVKTETDEQILDHTPYIKEAAEYSLKALEDFDAYRKEPTGRKNEMRGPRKESTHVKNVVTKTELFLKVSTKPNSLVR
nr:AlNc14C51G4026 [Albugo laibachii Nc14]|eukprot:CCA18506.1 AlNc14C51G4026 [Albugo laibachii Nc14]